VVAAKGWGERRPQAPHPARGDGRHVDVERPAHARISRSARFKCHRVIERSAYRRKASSPPASTDGNCDPQKCRGCGVSAPRRIVSAVSKRITGSAPVQGHERSREPRNVAFVRDNHDRRIAPRREAPSARRCTGLSPSEASVGCRPDPRRVRKRAKGGSRPVVVGHRRVVGQRERSCASPTRSSASDSVGAACRRSKASITGALRRSPRRRRRKKRQSVNNGHRTSAAKFARGRHGSVARVQLPLREYPFAGKRQARRAGREGALPSPRAVTDPTPPRRPRAGHPNRRHDLVSPTRWTASLRAPRWPATSGPSRISRRA